MLGNYAGGTPTLTDIPGWRRCNFTETDRQVWCKMGYRSTKQPVFTLEIAAILDPRTQTVRNSPVTRAARQTVCNRLPELARAIDRPCPADSNLIRIRSENAGAGVSREAIASGAGTPPTCRTWGWHR